MTKLAIKQIEKSSTLPEDARARLEYHLRGLEEAFGQLYPDGEIISFGNHRGERRDYRKHLVAGDLVGGATITLRSHLPEEAPEAVDFIEARWPQLASQSTSIRSAISRALRRWRARLFLRLALIGERVLWPRNPRAS
jgi:hypothetical protein